MKRSVLALSVVAVLGGGAAMAASPNVQGGSSSTSKVAVGKSNHLYFNGQNSGLKFENSFLGFIDIRKGPINGSNAAIAKDPDGGQGAIMTGADAGLPAIVSNLKIAQVWSASTTQGTSKFNINSIRQIATLSFAPQFGGLVIGQVADASSGTSLPIGSGVYFGEWAPRATGTPPANSTNLNMTNGNRTVWYVGDNAVKNTPNLLSVNYNVIGINQTGTDASGNVLAGGLPTSPNLYRGTLTANYNNPSVPNALTGDLIRTTSDFVTINATINNTGQFSGNGTEGRFYNNANQLAGIYTGGGTAASNIAFGGSWNGTGTITPAP